MSMISHCLAARVASGNAMTLGSSHIKLPMSETPRGRLLASDVTICIPEAPVRSLKTPEYMKLW